MPSAAIEQLPDSSPPDSAEGRIGLFDSGVGGLSVLQAVARQLPDASLVYFADQKYCPYGPRPAPEIQALSARLARFLIEQHCRVIVVACNTASAAALYDLRKTFPETPFIGMEPAVKPAVSRTRTGKIAVLATRGTLQGELFVNTRAEFARGVQVETVYPADWVERVEHGDIDSPETLESVRRVIQPLLDEGIDEIALGCTHYPFLTPLIEQVAQGRAAILDPSDAVAKQTARIFRAPASSVASRGDTIYYTSGDADDLARVLGKLLGTRNARVMEENP